MNDDDLKEVIWFIEKEIMIKTPKYYRTQKEIFEQWSFRKWGLEELKGYILNLWPIKSVEESIYIFLRDMERLACSAKQPKKKRMFSIAWEVGIEMLDVIIYNRIIR